MNQFSGDQHQVDHTFATLKPDDFGPLRLHYRREWYVDPNVGYWLGEQGLVRAGAETDDAPPALRPFDDTE